jgi:CHAD domain-containing protein
MADADDKFPLLDYLDELVDELRDLTPAAVRGDDADAVHDARVATRRLKAALDLMDQVVARKHRKPIAKISRLLRNRLGRLRDLDVMLGQLAKIKSARLESAVNWMKETLQNLRHKAVARAAEDIPPSKVLSRLGCWWGLRQEILAAQDAVPTLLAASVHLQLDAFLEQIEPMKDPHRLRIAGKSLRYTLEMAKAEKILLPKQAIAHFKHIQDALGLWHDDVVLAERIMEESAGEMLAHHDAELQQMLLSLAAAMVKRARHQLAKAAELWKNEGEDLARDIREAFPLTAPAEELPAPALQPADPAASGE